MTKSITALSSNTCPVPLPVMQPPRSDLETQKKITGIMKEKVSGMDYQKLCIQTMFPVEMEQKLACSKAPRNLCKLMEEFSNSGVSKSVIHRLKKYINEQELQKLDKTTWKTFLTQALGCKDGISKPSKMPEEPNEVFHLLLSECLNNSILPASHKLNLMQVLLHVALTQGNMRVAESLLNLTFAFPFLNENEVGVNILYLCYNFDDRLSLQYALIIKMMLSHIKKFDQERLLTYIDKLSSEECADEKDKAACAFLKSIVISGPLDNLELIDAVRKVSNS